MGLQKIGSNVLIGKAKVINLAIQDIGMGRYQWQLFILCGFGWFADKYVFLTLLVVIDANMTLVSGFR